MLLQKIQVTKNSEIDLHLKVRGKTAAADRCKTHLYVANMQAIEETAYVVTQRDIYQFYGNIIYKTI